MNDNLIDLLHTSSVVTPIFVTLLVLLITAAVIAYLYETRTSIESDDDKLAKLRRIQEANRDARIEEERLMHLAKTGELPAKDRMAVLNRGADVPQTDENYLRLTLPVGLIEAASRHGFEVWAHTTKNELILFDVEITNFKVQKRVITYVLGYVLELDESEQNELIRQARKNVNRRALRAGYIPVARKAGRPAREKTAIAA